MLIDAEGVIFSSSSLLLEPVRPERVLRARPGRSVAGSSSALVKLVAAVDIIAEIEARLKLFHCDEINNPNKFNYYI